jgi:hypothetical protein
MIVGQSKSIGVEPIDICNAVWIVIKGHP